MVLPLSLDVVSWSSVATDVALGLVLGGVGGVFGVGGGLMAIPALSWLFGMDQQLAQGTALVMVAPNVMLGFARYKQRNPIAWRMVGVLGASAVVSAWFAARWAADLGARELRSAFALFLLAMVGSILWSLRQQAAARPGVAAPHEAPIAADATLGPRWLPALGMLSGVFSGLFTVGGGVVATPILTGLFGVRRQTMAQGLSLALVVPGALIALAAYAQAGHVNWAVGLPMAAGGLVSISWGVALAHSLPERALRLAFCGLLSATALAMF
ncbi:MAG: hypothetical protein RI907_1253 [Pseudomonadota bacterium]|jgi:uncharacterized membrane protein YfcA